MRIVIPTADFPPIRGGISTVTLQLARELARLGHEVTVVAPFFQDMSDSDSEEPYGIIRYHGYHTGWLRALPMFFAAYRSIRHGDVIIAINVSSGGIIGWISRSIWKKPYVVAAYAYEFLKFRKNQVIKRILLSIYNHSIRIIAISRFTRDQLIRFGVHPEQIAVILPGASISPISSQDFIRSVQERLLLSDSRIILAVGRFVKRKGHRVLIQAMPRILEKCPKAQLVLVGDGPELDFCVKLARQLGVRDHVLFTGILSDDEVAALYQLCEVFALPTSAEDDGQVEGFGLVFAEASAYGKPVIAGRSGGVEDAVIHGETGIIVEPDNPEAVAETILRVFDEPEWAKCLGEKGRERVLRELNWQVFATRLLEEIKQTP